MKKAKGKDLIFIGQISRDGTEIIFPKRGCPPHIFDTEFTLISLSITHGTYIAASDSLFTVKLKTP